MIFFLSCFEGSNDEKMVRHQKGRGSIVKCGETLFEGEVLVKITRDSPCMMVLWKLLNTCGWLFGAFKICCGIYSQTQNCRNSLPWHTVDQLVMNAQNEMLLWLAVMDFVKIWTHCKAKHLMAQHDETRIYMLKAELKMDASQTVKEEKWWFLTWLHARYLHDLKML